MAKLTIGDIEAGMILASDVKDRAGRVLLKSGIELVEKHLKILKSWGVVQVEIAGGERVTAYQMVIEHHPELQQEAEGIVKELFRHVDSEHPLFLELIPIWVKRHVKKRAVEA